jgi:hypothetical protein
MPTLNDLLAGRHYATVAPIRKAAAPPASRPTAAAASRLRRQGDVAQEAITKADLKSHLKQVRSRIEKNADSPAWFGWLPAWVPPLITAQRPMRSSI